MKRVKSHKKYVRKILEKLKAINPKTVIIFDSYASNDLTRDSDLDFLVVLDVDRVPHNYDEKIKMKLEVRRAIRDINKEVAVDLLIYTIPEYEEFIKSDSSFSKEIKETGKIIYEKTSKAMA